MVLASRVRALRHSRQLSWEDHGPNNNGDNDNDGVLEDDIRTVLLSYTPLYRQSLVGATAHDCDQRTTARGG